MKLKAVLNQENHTYQFFDKETGEVFTNDISITQAIRELGVAPDYSSIDTEVLDKASKRGTYLHQFTEDSIEVLKFTKTLTSDFGKDYNDNYSLDYLNGIRDYVKLFQKRDGAPNIKSLVATEQIVMFRTPDDKVVAGSIDLISLDLIHGLFKYCISDLKFTSTYHQEAVEMQLNLYLYALKYMLKNEIEINGLKMGKLEEIVKDLGALECVHITREKLSLHPLKVYDLEKMDDVVDCIDCGLPYLDDNQLSLTEDVDLAKLQDLEHKISQYEHMVDTLNEQLYTIRKIILESMETQGVKEYRVGDVKYTYVKPTESKQLDRHQVELYLTQEQLEECIKKVPRKASVRVSIERKDKQLSIDED